MPQYPKPTPGAYSTPYKNVAPQGPQYVEGAGMRKAASMAQQFSGLSASLGEATGLAQQQFNEEDFKRGQQMVMDGEKDFRQREAAGELVITPPMQRGISTMQGKVDGQAFITKYQQAYAGSNDEQLRDPVYAKSLYEEMLSTDVSSSKKGNPHYAGSFLTMTSHPEGKGENTVLQNMIGAEGRLKDYGIALLGTTAGNATQGILQTLGASHPSSEEYKAATPGVVSALAADYNLQANGDKDAITVTGEIPTGYRGDGWWTANGGQGAVQFVMSTIDAAIQSNRDPRIVLQALEQVTTGTGMLTDIPQVREVIRTALQHDGRIDKGVKSWQAHIQRQNSDKMVEYKTNKHAITLAAGNGDVEGVAEGVKKQQELISLLYLGDDKWKEIAELKYAELDVLDYHDDIQRAAQEKLVESGLKEAQDAASTLEASKMVVGYLVGDVTPNADGTATLSSGIVSMANPLDAKQSSDEFIKTVMKATGLKKEEVKGLFAQNFEASFTQAATALFTGRSNSGDTDHAEYLANFLTNFTNNYNQALPHLTQFYQKLYQQQQLPGADLDALFNSTEGLQLTAVVMAGIRMQEIGLLKKLTDPGYGTGNDIQFVSQSLGLNPSAADVQTRLRQIIKTEGSADPMSEELKELKYPKSSFRRGLSVDAAVELGDYRKDHDLILDNLGEANEMFKGVDLPDWIENQIRGDIFEIARDLDRSSNDYTLETAIDHTIKTRARDMVHKVSKEGNGFFLHNRELHKWLGAPDGIKEEDLPAFSNFVRDVLILPEDRLESQEASVGKAMTNPMQTGDLSIDDKTTAAMEGRPGRHIKDLGFQRQFTDEEIIFTGDRNGHIWISSGGDDILPNTAHLTNAEIEAIIPAFLDAQKNKVVIPDAGEMSGRDLASYRKISEMLANLRKSDETYGIKRMSSLATSGIRKRASRNDTSIPEMLSGNLPSPASEVESDQRVYTELWRQDNERVVWHNTTTNEYYFNGPHPSTTSDPSVRQLPNGWTSGNVVRIGAEPTIEPFERTTGPHIEGELGVKAAVDFVREDLLLLDPSEPYTPPEGVAWTPDARREAQLLYTNLGARPMEPRYAPQQIPPTTEEEFNEYVAAFDVQIQEGVLRGLYDMGPQHYSKPDWNTDTGAAALETERAAYGVPQLEFPIERGAVQPWQMGAAVKPAFVQEQREELIGRQMEGLSGQGSPHIDKTTGKPKRAPRRGNRSSGPRRKRN